MPALSKLLALGGALYLAAASPAFAQGVSSLDERIRRGAIFDESMNLATIGLLTDGVGGTSVRIASDLSHTFDQLGKVRILAMQGKGSVQNVADIIYLKGVDISIVQLDALEYYKRSVWGGVGQAIQYVTSMYDEEVHIVARRDVEGVNQLAGRRVSLDLPGSGTNLTASLMFEALQIPVQPVVLDQAQALAALDRGTVDAVALVSGKPIDLLAKLAAEKPDRFHLLRIPPVPQLLESYQPARLTSADYPGLVPAGEAVDTISVTSVLAVFNWKPETERYKRVARFVDAFFTGFSDLRQEYRHPKWAEVDLAADVPGWTRFRAADEWLKRAAVARRQPEGGRENIRKAFEAFFREQVPLLHDLLSEPERAQLFDRFQDWQRQSAAGPGPAPGPVAR